MLYFKVLPMISIGMDLYDTADRVQYVLTFGIEQGSNSNALVDVNKIVQQLSMAVIILIQ